MTRHNANLFVSCFASSMVFLAATVVHAAPPFVTDDPEPVEYKHWEFYVAGSYNHEADQDEGMLPMVEVNYGVLPDVHLHLIAPVAFAHERGNSSHYGYGDTELGAKFRFVHESKYVPQIGTFPLVELPTGNDKLGLGNGKAQVFLPLWLQKRFGEWTTYGGGGWWYNPGDDNQNFWRVGWEIQRPITDQVTLGGEIFHETAATRGETGHTAFNLGGFYDLTEHQHILFSAGRDFDGPSHFACYLAFQLTL